MTDNIFDEKAASIFLGGSQSPISVRTLQKWRLEGVGPRFFKVGRLVRYRQVELEKYVNDNTYSSTSQMTN